MNFMKHTLCGPSSLERRALCPGSLAQESQIQFTGLDAAADSGTRCHEAMEAYILGRPEPSLSDAELKLVNRAKEALEFLLMGDEIIQDGSESKVRKTRGGANVYVELELLDLPYSSESSEIGTMDLVFVYEDHMLLIDWKFGGAFVPAPKWNLQLKGYALGLWKDFPTLPIHVAVVQPQVMPDFQVVPWVYEPEERDAIFSELSGIVSRCHREPELLVVGKACQFCSAARMLTCPATKRALGAFSMLDADAGLALDHLDDMELAQVLAAAKSAEKSAKLVVAEARKLAMAGRSIAGWSCNQDASGSYRLAQKAESPGWPRDAIKRDFRDQLKDLLFQD